MPGRLQRIRRTALSLGPPARRRHVRPGGVPTANPPHSRPYAGVHLLHGGRAGGNQSGFHRRALLLSGAARVDLLGSRVAPYLARRLHQTITESCSNCRTRSRSTLPTAGAPSAQRLARAAVRFRRPLAKNGNTIHLRPTPRKTTSSSSPSPAWGPTPVTTATWPTSTAAAPTFWAECPGWRL